MGKKGFVFMNWGFSPFFPEIPFYGFDERYCRSGRLFKKGYYFEIYQPVWVSSSTFVDVFFVSRLTITIATIAITKA